jgi:hypothetical protein
MIEQNKFKDLKVCFVTLCNIRGDTSQPVVQDQAILSQY